MTHQTRAQTKGAEPIGSAEAEFYAKQISEKERQLQGQSAALRKEREELLKLRSTNAEMESVLMALNQIRAELTPLKDVSTRMENLEKELGDLSRPASEAKETPEPCIQPEEEKYLATTYLKIKDVLPDIPPYNGYKISVFEFARACERARDLIHPHQELSRLTRFFKFIFHFYSFKYKKYCNL